jgi:hypothetical protein
VRGVDVVVSRQDITGILVDTKSTVVEIEAAGRITRNRSLRGLAHCRR